MHNSCIFCTLIGEGQTNACFIADFQHSIAFLNFDQVQYPGQSLLILKEHHEHLHKIPALAQAVTLEQVELANALIKVYSSPRMNYECLGNEVAHVHWHLIPRQPGDPRWGGPPLHRRLPAAERLRDDRYRSLAAPIRAALGQ